MHGKVGRVQTGYLTEYTNQAKRHTLSIKRQGHTRDLVKVSVSTKGVRC
jgi:hypothetical protein